MRDLMCSGMRDTTKLRKRCVRRSVLSSDGGAEDESPHISKFVPMFARAQFVGEHSVNLSSQSMRWPTKTTQNIEDIPTVQELMI